MSVKAKLAAICFCLIIFAGALSGCGTQSESSQSTDSATSAALQSSEIAVDFDDLD